MNKKSNAYFYTVNDLMEKKFLKQTVLSLDNSFVFFVMVMVMINEQNYDLKKEINTHVTDIFI